MVKKNPSRTTITYREIICPSSIRGASRVTWTRRGRGIHWEPAGRISPVEENLCWARTTARLKAFIPSLLPAAYCSSSLLWLRKFASNFTNPWRPLLFHNSVPSLWQLNSQRKEPPAKFSVHLSYTNKQTLSQEKEEKITEEGFYGSSWEELALPLFQNEMGNIGLCYVLWPTLECPLKTVCKQRASSYFQSLTFLNLSTSSQDFGLMRRQPSKITLTLLISQLNSTEIQTSP